MPPLRRAGRVMREASYSGLSRRGLKYAPAMRSFVSSTRRSGHGMPSSFRRELSHSHPPKPAAAATPATMKSRRVRRRSSRSMSRSSSGSLPASSSLIDHLHTDHHRPEVVPSRLDHLSDVHDEEDHVSDRQPEVEEARGLISVQEPAKPAELHPLIDGHPAEQGEESHHDAQRVVDFLRCV